MDEKGTVYFFTGLSGAGKTTIGGMFYKRLKRRSPDAILVDGDHSRFRIGDHDYSTEGRRKGAHNQMEYCKEIADQGQDVVLCSISMYRDVREWARANIENYREIYIKVSMETLRRRDQKGLYTRVCKDVVGVDLPWDEPETPDVVIENEGQERPEDIVAELENRFWGGGRSNIALIIAGGSGHRMHNEIPKQFLNVNDKPIIVYTLEAFQTHPDIDEIGVVCLEGWQEILWAYARQYQIDKLKWVVPGGENGQDSIRNGVFEAERRYRGEDLLLVHDAIRPMVSHEIISDCIIQCRAYGSAITVTPCNTAVLRRGEGGASSGSIPRETLAMTQTPQAFPIGKLAQAHRAALERGITNSVASCTLLSELGETLHFSIGAATNIKLTTPDDLKIFRALLAVRNTAVG